MPKGSKRAGSRKGRPSARLYGEPDFTVNDFANAEPGTAVVASGRMKKSVANSVVNQAKQLTGVTVKDDDDLAWYEKELSDFDVEPGVDLSSDDEDIEVNGDSSPVKTSRKKKREEDPEPWTGGVVYPQDLWFLVSRFIHPENVGRFACICKQAHIVVHSAQFWINMYRRYSQRDREMPSILRPDSIEKIHGIRAHVIRYLFYTYPLFEARVKHSIPFETEPGILHGRKCTLTWYQKEKSLWYFYFKFQSAATNTCPLANKENKCRELKLHPNLWIFQPDVYDNPEENSVVLQVVSRHFVSLPMVLGLVLKQTLLTLGHGLKHHKLKLLFGDQYVTNDKRMLNLGTALVIDPVLNMRVLHWWDPRYPYRPHT